MVSSKQIDVAKSSVTLLLGLNLLGKYKMVVDNVQNSLILHKLNFIFPLLLKQGHVILEWQIYYSML